MSIIHSISQSLRNYADSGAGMSWLARPALARGRQGPPSVFETVILGAGPAGTGPLVWAARQGLLGDWLERGVAVVDRRPAIGGTIGQYALNADTAAGTFLECLDGRDESPLAPLRGGRAARALTSCNAAAPSLPLVGRFFDQVGATLAAELDRHPRSHFFGGMEVAGLQCCRDGSVLADVVMPQGQHLSLRAASAVLALGGRQAPFHRVELQPGVGLDRWQGKVMTSDRLMALGGAEAACRLLTRRRRPLVVILGGSHSALSAAWTLLERMPSLWLPEGAVHLLYRTPPRVFYPSRADAIADGYAFTEADVCQATGRVHRMGGLRGDGRQVWRRTLNRPDAPHDPRLVARPIADCSPYELNRLLDAADLIVPAFGYRLRTVPIRSADGAPIPLARSGPAVDGQSRVLTEHGRPLPNIFGVGLGSGFRPWGAMGGEASFKGQQNSLWLYQNGLGEMIHAGVRQYADALTAPAEPASLLKEAG